MSVERLVLNLEFRFIAEQVVYGSRERQMLEELAHANERLSYATGSVDERVAARTSAEKLREIAKWFAERGP